MANFDDSPTDRQSAELAEVRRHDTQISHRALVQSRLAYEEMRRKVTELESQLAQRQTELSQWCDRLTMSERETLQVRARLATTLKEHERLSSANTCLQQQLAVVLREREASPAIRTKTAAAAEAAFSRLCEKFGPVVAGRIQQFDGMTALRLTMEASNFDAAMDEALDAVAVEHITAIDRVTAQLPVPAEMRRTKDAILL